MKLLEKRVLFSNCLLQLLNKIKFSEYDCMIEEVRRGKQQTEWNATHCKQFVSGTRCERTKEQHGPLAHSFAPIGIDKSVHLNGLAVDLILVLNGYPVWAVGPYREFGVFWKSLHELCRWGGDFPGDSGHFSLEHGGRK